MINCADDDQLLWINEEIHCFDLEETHLILPKQDRMRLDSFWKQRDGKKLTKCSSYEGNNLGRHQC